MSGVGDVFSCGNRKDKVVKEKRMNTVEWMNIFFFFIFCFSSSYKLFILSFFSFLFILFFFIVVFWLVFFQIWALNDFFLFIRKRIYRIFCLFSSLFFLLSTPILLLSLWRITFFFVVSKFLLMILFFCYFGHFAVTLWCVWVCVCLMWFVAK